jgi:hypothetical protein
MTKKQNALIWQALLDVCVRDNAADYAYAERITKPLVNKDPSFDIQDFITTALYVKYIHAVSQILHRKV